MSYQYCTCFLSYINFVYKRLTVNPLSRKHLSFDLYFGNSSSRHLKNWLKCAENINEKCCKVLWGLLSMGEVKKCRGPECTHYFHQPRTHHHDELG